MIRLETRACTQATGAGCSNRAIGQHQCLHKAEHEETEPRDLAEGQVTLEVQGLDDGGRCHDHRSRGDVVAAALGVGDVLADRIRVSLSLLRNQLALDRR